MSLRITAANATELSDGVWLLRNMPPHQVRHFGGSSKAIGTRSVLLLNGCDYDAENRQLSFDIDDAAALNVGTSAEVIAISSELTPDGAKAATKNSDPTPAGPGDREFLSLVRTELSEDLARAAEMMLSAVRAKSSGDLKRGQSRNFSETPDNFWYVIVQPRINELSITVRGPVDHFENVADLEIKDDRGNTRFKVRGVDDVPSALRLIFHAIRKS